MDKILEMAFTEPARWSDAIDKAYDKGIDQKILRQLCDENTRLTMYRFIRDGQYMIAPPHTALIPKDKPGEYRTVYINEQPDRVLCPLGNDLLFDLCPDMVHPSCRSYQKGISCGDIVKEVSRQIVAANTNVQIGWKSDLSKYFDSVPIEYIDRAFDMVEERHGKSKLIDVFRQYYHSDWYFDTDGNLVQKYQSLKQGCALASWLADVILYDIDDKLSSMKGFYYRYSDDMIYIGEDYDEAMRVLQEELEKMNMKLNPKKVEPIDANHWVTFLGFSIKGNDISLSPNGIHKFQTAIDEATEDKTNYESAKHAVYRALYKGYNDFSWATRVLRVINVKHDINVLNGYVMDALRAVQTGKRKLGGLGYVRERKNGCIARGTGKNVKANKGKIATLDDYLTIGCMANALRTSRAAYETLVATRM